MTRPSPYIPVALRASSAFTAPLDATLAAYRSRREARALAAGPWPVVVSS